MINQTKSIQAIQANIERVIKGKPQVVELAVVCLLARGHLLIEDVPGVGKTTLAYSLARSLDCSFSRIQFTSDLLPSDILGVSIFLQQQQAFEFRPGPIFANVVLADEINRTTPKTQSSLLEAMNEAQVSVDTQTYPLPQPFMVIATQNPVEHHGTFPLPESQLDRFLMRIRIGYPDRSAERLIVRHVMAPGTHAGEAVISGEELLELQEAVARVNVDESLVEYMLAVVERTRSHNSLAMGVSPRGAQALFRSVQALAAVSGRDFATPDDVKRLVLPVFAHRVVVNSRASLSYQSTEAAENILTEILTLVDVPL